MFFELQRKRLEEQNKDLIGTMCYLDATAKTLEYPDIPDGNDSAEIEIFLDKEPVGPDASHRRVISNAVEKVGLSSDCIALWVENAFREGKVPLDMPSFKAIVDTVLSESIEEDLYALKDKDKRLHNVLKYNLLPLFSLMSSSELQYLSELAKSIDSPFEFIVEFSQLASFQLPVIEEEMEDTARNIRQFAGRWMTKNKTNFISRALEILAVPKKSIPRSQIVTPEVESLQEETRIIGEELKKSSLNNWDVHLSDGYHLVTGREEVIGENLADYKEAIDKLFLKSGRSSSIKTLSIVKALDWFLNVPEEILRIWPKEEVDGVEYYKICRGAARIFCHLDRNDRNLTFFTYQKTDMAYHFRS